MKTLNPTLWRTCRTLSGRNRLRLLREILERPGQNVSQLAERAGIGVSDASQELRRLQSRGLLRRSAHGLAIVYQAIPDPQVPSAAPLLHALKAALAASKSEESIRQTASALAHERRIALAGALLHDPQDGTQLARQTRLGAATLRWHVKKMKTAGLVGKAGKRYVLRPDSSPLAAVLVHLLRAAV